MKRERFKGLLAGFLIAILTIGLGANVLAAGRTISIDDGVKLTIDGVEFVPTDDNGNVADVFTYNGTVYAPVKAVAEALGSKTNYYVNTRTTAIKTMTSDFNYIGETKAKHIALDHAGIQESNVVFLSIDLERKNSQMIYDVEFYANNIEYDYDIDATNGTIVSYDRDIDWYTPPTESKNYIGETKAKEIALNHAGVSAANAVFVTVKLDYDDGRAEYEVEFYSGNTEYDYEIDALTGAIRGYDRDIENYSIPTNTTSKNYIGEAKAKEIALNHAGVSAANAVFVTVKLDYDDGRAEYEVEFYSGNTEYDYEINALTGAILGYDRDIENYSIPSNTTSNNYIGTEKAKSIAQNKAPSGAKIIKCKFDYDDGRAIYEVELRNGRMEYECDIDAVTGSILKWDAEYDD